MSSKFYEIGTNITGSTGVCINSQIKPFKHHFGVNLHLCNMIMDRTNNQFNVVVCRMCLLLSLYFLCCYPKVKVIRKVFEVDVKTFMKHTLKIILYLKELKIVSSRVFYVI